jgi:uncharacterized protein YlxW (UPF0749 family)
LRLPTRWNAFVPVVALAAGLLFATSANVSRGTDLRSQGNNGLVGLVRAAQKEATDDAATVQTLDQQIAAATGAAADSDGEIAAIQNGSAPLQAAAGLTAMIGPGLAVTLDDAHGDPVDASIDPNDTVVHQSDLQAVVNALWAGGAEAMSIADQRVIATSAVRCVGNTLLLNGRVYSPPFRIIAIGPADLMQAALGRSRGVALYRQAADALGLTYRVQAETSVRVPAYDATLVLSTAKVAR